MDSEDLTPYESFIKYQFNVFTTTILQEDLKQAYGMREKLKEELVEYDELKQTIIVTKNPEIQESGLQTALNIGCDFFVDAAVPDVSKIFLSLGAGLFIECTMDEALTFIGNKQKLLEHQIEFMTSKIAQVEACITLSHTAISPSPHLADVEQLVVPETTHENPTEPPPKSTISPVIAVQNCLFKYLQSVTPKI